MGQVHHGSATTTAAVRRAIQHSQESLRALAKRYGINPKTVAKWKKRTSTDDRRTGPAEPHSTVLSVEDEAIRNRIEIMFGRLKDWRRVATRYDRCPTVFFSAIALAATVLFWL